MFFLSLLILWLIDESSIDYSLMDFWYQTALYYWNISSFVQMYHILNVQLNLII